MSEMAVSIEKTGTVKVYRTFYLLDDVVDGDYPRDDVWEDVFENVSMDEAVDILSREGLSFAATGTDWAALPDGSYTVNYATGQECEVSGHLYGFSAGAHAAIANRVG